MSVITGKHMESRQETCADVMQKSMHLHSLASNGAEVLRFSLNDATDKRRHFMVMRDVCVSFTDDSLGLTCYRNSLSFGVNPLISGIMCHLENLNCFCQLYIC